MVKFRVVILDDFDNIQEIVYASKEYHDKRDPAWCSWEGEELKMLCELSNRYCFTDYNNCPILETQIFEDNKWKYYSDPLVDWFNL